MTKYLIAIMAVALGYLGVSNIAYSHRITKLEGDVKTLANERDMAVEVADKNKEALGNYVLSCESTIKLIKEQREKDKALEGSKQTVLDAIKTRPKQPYVGVTNNAQSAPSAVRDADYVRLLNTAYCEGNRDDPYCTSR